ELLVPGADVFDAPAREVQGGARRPVSCGAFMIGVRVADHIAEHRKAGGSMTTKRRLTECAEEGGLSAERELEFPVSALDHRCDHADRMVVLRDVEENANAVWSRNG